MPATDNELRSLLKKYADDQANPAEINNMLDLLQSDPESPVLLSFIQQLRMEIKTDEPENIDWEKIWNVIRLQTKVRKMQTAVWWKRIAVAASLLLIVFAAWYILSDRSVRQEVAKTEKGKDVPAPVSNRARLTLPNGQSIYLDSIGNGEIAVQGSTKLFKLPNGELASQTTDLGPGIPAGNNTLHNPYGSKIATIALSDGSKVWLNAGATLSFPVAFQGNERKVSIDGEAYFDIAPNNAKPFKVVKNDLEIQVLGTRFNVHAWDEENHQAVTLLQGSVKVVKGTGSRLLKPGQQALVTDKIEVMKEADINKTIAWKEGWFDFGNNTDIEIIMKEIERWYDVDVVYSDKITQGFGGSISRSATIAQVLEKFELTGRVHFRIEGRKIIVSK
jgi:transmembrane sensor